MTIRMEWFEFKISVALILVIAIGISVDLYARSRYAGRIQQYNDQIEFTCKNVANKIREQVIQYKPDAVKILITLTHEINCDPVLVYRVLLQPLGTFDAETFKRNRYYYQSSRGNNT